MKRSVNWTALLISIDHTNAPPICGMRYDRQPITRCGGRICYTTEALCISLIERHIGVTPSHSCDNRPIHYHVRLH
ncbi:hypothetical protein J6590_022421 [Homalodisca vitripennis]|nr:hypothetical protein J6590_022421 [Homalodisca vitripennis]